MTIAEWEDSVQDVVDWAEMPTCPHCGERGGEPLFIEGRPMSRWYNGEDGDEGCESFDGCTLCDPRKLERQREAAEEWGFLNGGSVDDSTDCPF